jgi:preprotein translocase subunit SecE
VTKETTASSASFSLAGYLQGVRQEWGRITWPGRQQIIAETLVVVVVVILFSVFVYVADKLFQFLIQVIT